MMLTLWDTLTKWATNFQDWIIKNGDNPLFWLALFFIGLIIGSFTISALNKDK
ncbi:MAG: hypothetical protein PHN42_01520 [Bacilli bacterium]|nr:hypothetical protein [Bacilli bacterium]